MSTTFRVKNSKSIVYTIYEIENILKEKVLFVGKNSSLSHKEFLSEEAYNYDLDKIEFLNVGEEGKSLRGVNIFYQNDYYYVKVHSPATKNDWDVAFLILKSLAIALDSNIENLEKKKIYTKNNILSFDYLREIDEGWLVTLDSINKGYMIGIDGMWVSFQVDKKLLEKYNYDRRLIFDKFVDFQWKAFTATPAVIAKLGSVLGGYYVLSIDLLTNLPNYPIMPAGFDDTNANSIPWGLIFVSEKEGKLGAMDYLEFIKYISKYNLKYVDSRYFQISMNSREARLALESRKQTNLILDLLNKSTPRK
jgi:hypothetical protein